MGKKYTCCLIIPMKLGIYILFLVQAVQSLYCLIMLLMMVYVAIQSLDSTTVFFEPPWECILAFILYACATSPIYLGLLLYFRWLIQRNYFTDSLLAKAHFFNIASIVFQFGFFTIFGYIGSNEQPYAMTGVELVHPSEDGEPRHWQISVWAINILITIAYLISQCYCRKITLNYAKYNDYEFY